MPSTNPRLSAVVEKPLYQWLRKKAKSEGISLSLLVRDLLREAYEMEEDVGLSRIAEERHRTYDPSTALTHEQVWGLKK